MSLTHRTPVTTNGHRRPGLIIRLTKRASALRVLRRLAGSLETDLLALFFPRVAGQELGGLERGAQFRVSPDQRSGNTVANGPDLTRRAAADNRGHDVEPLGRASDAKRFGHDQVVQLAAAEVL